MTFRRNRIAARRGGNKPLSGAPALFCLAVCLLTLAGCGSSGGALRTAASTTAASRSRTGRASITIHWPPRPANSKLIPEATNLVTVQMYLAVNGTPKLVGSGSATRSTSTSDTIEIDNLPVGTLTVVATAYPGTTTASPGVALATGSAMSPLVISDGNTANFSVTMASTIDHIDILGNPIVVAPDLGSLYAEAFNGADESKASVVMLSSDQVQWQSSAPTVATVNATGTGTTITSVAPGTTTITATDNESGKSASTVFTVNAAQYTASLIGNPGNGYTLVSSSYLSAGQMDTGAAVNNNGDIVCNFSTTGANGNVNHAFLYTLLTGFTDLGNLGGTLGATATGIDDGGQVVGYSYVAGNSNSADQHAFLYSSGTMQDLGTQSGTGSFAYGINASGQVVGEIEGLNASYSSFLYSAGTIQTIDSGFGSAYAINAAGQVAGYDENGAYLYTGGNFTTIAYPAQNSQSYGVGINSSGEVIGNYFPPSGGSYHAFIYTNGTSQSLETLAGITALQSTVSGINDSGQIVGNIEMNSQIYGAYPFVYANGTLQNLVNITSGGIDGSEDAYAFGITSSGVILAGSYNDLYLLIPVSGKAARPVTRQPTAPKAPPIPDWSKLRPTTMGSSRQGFGTHS